MDEKYFADITVSLRNGIAILLRLMYKLYK